MASKKRQRKSEPFSYYIEQLNDGGQSRNDWITRPIISLKPVYKNVYISNFEGTKKMMELNKSRNIAGINLRDDLEIDDDRVDNSLSIEDSMKVDQKDFDKFVKNVAKRIAELSDENEWVIVNCKAGINRASTAVLAWMTFECGLSFSEAFKILKKIKASAAKEFQFKNRYQSFTHGSTLNHFSWPSLYGDGSRKLKLALKI